MGSGKMDIGFMPVVNISLALPSVSWCLTSALIFNVPQDTEMFSVSVLK